MLFSKALLASGASWIAGCAPAREFRACAKIRYRQGDQPCLVRCLEDGGLRVEFDEPQRAVTPGQYAVFYDGETCLGGAVIEAAETARIS